MHNLLREGRRLFEETVEDGELKDCTETSREVAQTGHLPECTRQTRIAATGRHNNDALFHRSEEEVRRRMEIARAGLPRLTWAEIGEAFARRALEKELHAKQRAAEASGRLADMTYESRVAVTGRLFPDPVLLRSSDEARQRMAHGTTAESGPSSAGGGRPGPSAAGERPSG